MKILAVSGPAIIHLPNTASFTVIPIIPPSPFTNTIALSCSRTWSWANVENLCLDFVLGSCLWDILHELNCHFFCRANRSLTSDMHCQPASIVLMIKSKYGIIFLSDSTYTTQFCSRCDLRNCWKSSSSCQTVPVIELKIVRTHLLTPRIFKVSLLTLWYAHLVFSICHV